MAASSAGTATTGTATPSAAQAALQDYNDTLFNQLAASKTNVAVHPALEALMSLAFQGSAPAVSLPPSRAPAAYSEVLQRGLPELKAQTVNKQIVEEKEKLKVEMKKKREEQREEEERERKMNEAGASVSSSSAAGGRAHRSRRPTINQAAAAVVVPVAPGFQVGVVSRREQPAAAPTLGVDSAGGGDKGGARARAVSPSAVESEPKRRKTPAGAREGQLGTQRGREPERGRGHGPRSPPPAGPARRPGNSDAAQQQQQQQQQRVGGGGGGARHGSGGSDPDAGAAAAATPTEKKQATKKPPGPALVSKTCSLRAIVSCILAVG